MTLTNAKFLISTPHITPVCLSLLIYDFLILFQNEAGWIGFYATLAGIGAGLILARCADLFGGKMKLLLLVLFFGAAGCFLWFSLLCLRMIAYDDGKNENLKSIVYKKMQM